jgi:HD-GYP domain-containing protein (c-di-GMP phosphodiesterase class II)
VRQEDNKDSLMPLGENPVDVNDGDILLSSGIVLKRPYLEKLRLTGYKYDAACGESLSPYGINRGFSDILNKQTRSKASRSLKAVFKDVAVSKNLDLRPVKAVVSSIIKDILKKLVKDRPIPLVFFSDDDVCTHSINVCVISVICGLVTGLTTSELERLGVAAILHDVGKALIPDNLLKKPGKLSAAEFNFLKTHTSSGFALLQKHTYVDEAIARTALLHHERADGSGYPLGMKLKTIDMFSRIVAIADIYDAIITDRKYRPGISPCHAVDYLIFYGFHFLDYELVRIFVDSISIYPDGAKVILDTGEKAQVVAQNPGMPARPIIRIYTDTAGRELDESRLVDMMERTSVIIKSIISG